MFRGCWRSQFSIIRSVSGHAVDRGPREFLPGLLVRVALMGGLAGCGNEPRIVLVNASVTAPAILRSEAEQVVTPVRIDAPLRFENPGSQEQLLGVSKTGCSCYGIATEQFVLERKENISVPAGGSKELFFVAKLLEGDGDLSFRVGFQTQGGMGRGGEPVVHELRADCTMKVLPDLVLEPASLVIDLPRVDAAADSQPHSIVLKRVTRGKPASLTPPEFTMDPASLKVDGFRMEGVAEEVEPGLWRTIWKASATLGSLPDELRENGGVSVFTLEFPEEEAETKVYAGRRPETGKLPTLLEVVREAPERRVSGQVILRRSRGIVAPAQAHFGVLATGSEARTRRIVLTAADQSPFVVTVDETPPHVQAAPDSQEPAPQQWVTVTFNPAAEGAYEQPLVLKTTHPDDEEIRVVVKARVQ